MAYIDATFLQNAFGSANVTALTATSGERDLLITLAQGEVYSALYNAGYQTDAAPDDFAADGSDCPDTIRLAALGAWLELAHLRKRKELPETARIYTARVELLRDGRMEVPGLTKTTTRAVGGVVRPDVTSEVSDGGRPAVFSRKKMDGYG